MSQVLSLEQAGPIPSSSEQRMRLLSRALVWVFNALLAFIAFSAVTAFTVSLFFPAHVEIGASGGEFEPFKAYSPTTLDPGMTWLAAQPLSTRIAGIADVAIMSLPLALVVWHLRGLFRLYAAGIVFAPANAQRFKRIGLWLLAYPFAKVGANMLYQAFGGPDRAWYSSLLLFSLLLGGIVFVIAQVMERGEAIEAERAEFV